MSTLAALYFMLPAYVSNAVPPLIKRWKFLDKPMDFGIKIRGKRMFGPHKTWRGFFAGTVAGTAVFMMQQTWTPTGSQIALFDYSQASIWIGVALAAGALIGDAAKSLIKRQIGIAPGHPWPIFDQLDYVAGSLLIASFWHTPSWTDIGLIFAWSLLFTVVVKHIGYWIGVNKVAW